MKNLRKVELSSKICSDIKIGYFHKWEKNTDGKICGIVELEDGEIIVGDYSVIRFVDIPNGWVELIEPEEMTAEEYVRTKTDCSDCSDNLNVMKAYEDGIKEGERREQKKHEQKQSFEEWLKLNNMRHISFRGDALKGWNAALKSRGYEGE